MTKWLAASQLFPGQVVIVLEDWLAQEAQGYVHSFLKSNEILSYFYLLEMAKLPRLEHAVTFIDVALLQIFWKYKRW